MEVAPQYWQSPDTLEEPLGQHRRRHGQRQPVDATRSRAPSTSTQTAASSTAAAIAADTARNQADQQPRQHRAAARPRPARRQHRGREDGAAGGLQPLRAGQHAARRQPPGHRSSRPRSPSTWRRTRRSATPRAAITSAMNEIGMPATIHGSFQGTAQTFQQSLAQRADADPRRARRRLHRAGRALRELHPPITILSTLPSAGVGAVLALLLFNTEFSIIALIGVILLIGIVKKNAIMMIDFALDAERHHGRDPRRRRSTRPGCCASARS